MLHIYIHIIYIGGWSGYLYTYTHVDIYICIHAYTYIERFKVLRFDRVAKNEMQTVLYCRSVFLVSTSNLYIYSILLGGFEDSCIWLLCLGKHSEEI